MNASSNKHIVFLRQMHPSAKDWGGLEKLVLDWLKKIDYSQCKVTLVITKGFKDVYSQRLSDLGLSVILTEFPFNIYEGGDIRKFLNMFNFLKKLKPSTIIFLQGWFFDFILPHVLAGFFVTKNNAYMHENLGVSEAPQKTKNKYFDLIPHLSLWLYFYKLSQRMRAYYSRKILVVSQEIQRNLITLWDYPSNKIKVQYHGIDTASYLPLLQKRSQMRQSMGISLSDLVIIVTARFAKVKCLDRTIDAFDRLYETSNNLHLLMIGSGPLENELKNLANRKKSKERILFLGHVNNVPDYLQMSDIYILSSDNEGLSLALLEAMATGLICISTNCTGSNEVIENNTTGFIIDKNTEGVLEGLRKALHLTVDEKKKMSNDSIKTVTNKFEINKNIADALNTFGIPHLK